MVGANYKPESADNNYTNRKTCFFSGAVLYYGRINYPALKAMCNKYSKRRHFVRVCLFWVTNVTSATLFSVNMAVSKVKVLGELLHVATSIKGDCWTPYMTFGLLEALFAKIVSCLKLKLIPLSKQVTKAQKSRESIKDFIELHQDFQIW